MVHKIEQPEHGKSQKAQQSEAFDDLAGPLMTKKFIEFRKLVDAGVYSMTIDEKTDTLVIRDKQAKAVLSHERARDLESAYARFRDSDIDITLSDDTPENETWH